MQAYESLFDHLPPFPENLELVNNVHPSKWTNPTPKGVYDLIIIGAGPAGIVASRQAAQMGAKIALIERDLVGGDCLNVGCIPSKALLRTSRLYSDMREANKFGGVRPPEIPIDFKFIMQRMRHIRNRVAKHHSVYRLHEAGIDVFVGSAAFTDRDKVKVGDQVLSFRKAIVATGSRPRVPAIPGLPQIKFLTNESFFNLEALPKSLLVIGGGPLGCEMAQTFCRFGTEVSICQGDPMFLSNVERDGAQILSNALARDGVDIYLNSKIRTIQDDGTKNTVNLMSDDTPHTFSVEQILVSAGRLPDVSGLDLEKAGVRFKPHSGIEINEYLETSNPDIFTAGDVCPDRKFDHVQDGAARLAVSNALGSQKGAWPALLTPWCIYTDPEVAHVGLQVREARNLGVPVKTFTVLMHEVDRAVADGEEEGFVKVHTREGVDEILGATIVSRHAGDIINYISLAMSSKIGLTGLAQASFPYPTQAQGVKKAAQAFVQNMSHFRPASMPT